MTTQEKIAVMQAFIEGRDIEGRPKDDSRWCATWNISEDDEPEWDWMHEVYLVKKEPKILWLQYLGNGLYQQKFTGIGIKYVESEQQY